jgi:uncharacterized lipoprotein NlpE involved in copper resistance
MTRFAPALLLLALLGACQSSPKKEIATSDTAVAVDGLEVAPDTTRRLPTAPADWAGTYAGTLPCADCEGIRTELVLGSDGRYTLRRTYLGKSGTAPVADQGTWKALDAERGVVLDPNDAERRTEYRFSDDTTLQMLGRDGKAIESNFNYSLRKQ